MIHRRSWLSCVAAMVIAAANVFGQDTVQEPARRVPVLHEADVVVIDGGLSGVGAALGAARAGAKTILIERTGYLGGWLRGAGLGNVLATVAAESGAPTRKDDNVMGLAAWISGVDVNRFNAYAGSLPQGPDPAARAWLEARLGRPVTTRQPGEINWEAWLDRNATILGPKFRDAVDRGEVPLFYTVAGKGLVCSVEGLKLAHYEIAGGIARPRTYIANVDPTNILEVSEAHILSTQYLFKLTGFLRDNIPGFERAQLTRLADTTLNRAGRSVDNESAPLDYAAVEREVRHDDAIAILQRGADKGVYEVPYSAMLPREIDNLLAVGKSSSGGRYFRTHMLSVIMGQAAGAAGAIAAQDGVACKDVPIRKLQGELRKNGIPIPEK